MTEEERQVELTGGSPWGFSIQGGADFGAPLKVTKVSPGGKAALAGVQLNDVLKRVRDRECANLRHSEALYLIRTSGTSLSLVLQKGRAAPAPYQPERPLIRSATAPSAQRPPRSPPKRTSPKKQATSPLETSPIKTSPIKFSPPETSPIKSSPSPGESAGGHEWYRSNTSGEDPRHLSSSGEERRTKTPPQPIKAKPRSTTLPAPSNGSVSGPLSPHQQVLSPHQQVLSPHRQVQSPHQQVQSPHQQVPSLHQQVPSPHRQVPSPHQQVPSPHRQVLSPHQQVPSPPEAEPATLAPLNTSPTGPEGFGPGGRRRSGPKRRRELKPPPAQNARGLYDFTAETKHELSFRKGDQLHLLRTVDGNWLEAQLGDQKGIVPVSYVELCPTQGAESGAPSPHAVARYEFLAEESYELGFQKGARVALLSRVDDNWLQGRVGDRTGIFPAAFVDIITPLEEPEPPEPLADTTPGADTIPSADTIPVENEIRTHRDPSPEVSPGDLYRAVYSYSPQNEDELALEPGTEVHVVRRCEDGWYMGYDASNGAFGTFPGNYVLPI